MSSPTASPSLRNRCFGALRKVSPAHGLLPESYLPTGVPPQRFWAAKSAFIRDPRDSHTLSTRPNPRTTPSDGALEREWALEGSETSAELVDQQWRDQQREVEEREKKRTQTATQAVTQVRRRPPKRGKYHWTVVPSDIPLSDYTEELPTMGDGPRSPLSRGGRGNSEDSSRNMGDLRAATATKKQPLQSGKRGPPPPLLMTRPTTSGITQEFPDGNGIHPVPRPHNSRNTLVSPVSSTTRPLPVAGSSATPSTSLASSLGLVSPSNESQPGPRSARDNTGTSPQTSARTQPLGNRQDSTDRTRPPPSTFSPRTYRYNHETGFSSIVPKIVPTTPDSHDRAAEVAHEHGIGSDALRGPPSPSTPSSPRYSASSEHSPGDTTSPVDGSSTESTLESRLGYDLAANSIAMRIRSESTLVPIRKERPVDIEPIPQQPPPTTFHQAHSHVLPPPLPLPLYPPPSSDGPPTATPTTSSISTSYAQLPVHKPILQSPTSTSPPIPGPLKPPLSDDDSDGGSDVGGTPWALSDNAGGTLGTWQTTFKSDHVKSLPPLVVDHGALRYQQQKLSEPWSLPQILPFMPPEYPPPPRGPPKGVFDGDFRPVVEEMYDRLGDFFPEHDLDEPVIEASSGGTSPTSPEPAQPFPAPDMRKHKKSIRAIANEYKRELDRASGVTSMNSANVLRKRSTKLWGSKVEEVIVEQVKSASLALSTSEESPSEPKRTFRGKRSGPSRLTIM